MKLDRLKNGKVYRIENNKIIDEEGVVLIDLESCSTGDLKFIDAGIGRRRLISSFSIICSSFLMVNGFFLVFDSKLFWALVSGFFSAVMMGIGIGCMMNSGVYGILFVKGKRFWLENEEEHKKIKDVILYIKEREKIKREESKKRGEKEDEVRKRWKFW